MIKFLSFVIILVAASLISPTLAEPHLSCKKCSIQDSECLTREAQEHLKQFTNGIPEYHIEKLDDMFIGTFEINADGVHHVLHNIKITGLGNAKINDISFDTYFKLIHISFDATLDINADYTIEGMFFAKPISGEGTTTFTARDIQIDLLISYDINANENGKHRLVIKRYRSGFAIKDCVEYQYENLFNGDTEKGQVVNDLLNENWVTITNLFGRDFFSKIVDKVFNAIKTFGHSNYFEDIFLYR